MELIRLWENDPFDLLFFHLTARFLLKNLLFVWQGKESFASYESLEQLHRFVFVLGVTHVFYSFVAIALAMIKVEMVLFYYNICSLTFHRTFLFIFIKRSKLVDVDL